MSASPDERYVAAEIALEQVTEARIKVISVWVYDTLTNQIVLKVEGGVAPVWLGKEALMMCIPVVEQGSRLSKLRVYRLASLEVAAERALPVVFFPSIAIDQQTVMGVALMDESASKSGAALATYSLESGQLSKLQWRTDSARLAYDFQSKRVAVLESLSREMVLLSLEDKKQIRQVKSCPELPGVTIIAWTEGGMLIGIVSEKIFTLVYQIDMQKCQSRLIGEFTGQLAGISGDWIAVYDSQHRRLSLWNITQRKPLLEIFGDFTAVCPLPHTGRVVGFRDLGERVQFAVYTVSRRGSR